MLTTGYVLVLPWKVYPSQHKVRVVAQLKIADGRLYEADRDVTVRLAPPALRKVQPPAEGPGPDVNQDPLLPIPPEPEKIRPPTVTPPEPEKIKPPPAPTPEPIPNLPTPVGPAGPLLPPPTPPPGPNKTVSGWGDPAPAPPPAAQIEKPVPLPSEW